MQANKDVQKNLYNFRNLWILDTVAEHGSINAASHHLPLTQPAVSRVIKLLEQALGLTIFERQLDGVKLTEFGEIVLHRVRRATRCLADAEKALTWDGRGPHVANRSAPFHRVIKFRHLQALIETANCRNASIAARRIGLSQPAVYRSLRELEQIVDASLFERRYRQMIPTRQGEKLLRYAKLALTELRYCESELSAGTGSISDQVRIGILPLLQTILVPQAIEILSRKLPGLRFSILDEPYEALVSDLRSGDIDMIVGALRNPAPVDDVVEETLFTDVLSVVARAQHPLVSQKKVSITQLAEGAWVVPQAGTLIRDYFDRMFREAGIAVPSDLIEASSVSTIRALLLESDRLAIISRGRIHYEERSGVLAPLPFSLHGTQRSIGVSIRAGASLPPGVEAFLGQLRGLASGAEE